MTYGSGLFWKSDSSHAGVSLYHPHLLQITHLPLGCNQQTPHINSCAGLCSSLHTSFVLALLALCICLPGFYTMTWIPACLCQTDLWSLTAWFTNQERLHVSLWSTQKHPRFHFFFWMDCHEVGFIYSCPPQAKLGLLGTSSCLAPSGSWEKCQTTQWMR